MNLFTLFFCYVVYFTTKSQVRCQNFKNTNATNFNGGEENKVTNEEISLKNLARKFVNDCTSPDLTDESRDGRQFNRKGTNKYVPYGINNNKRNGNGYYTDNDEDDDEDCEDEDRNRQHYNKRNTPQGGMTGFNSYGNNRNNNRGSGGGRNGNNNNKNNCGDNNGEDSDEENENGGGSNGRNSNSGRNNGSGSWRTGNNNNNRRNSGNNHSNSGGGGNNGRDHNRDDSHNNYGRRQYPQYPIGQDDFYYRVKRATNNGGDNVKCVSQCVFGYLQVLDDNKVPSEARLIKYLQDNITNEMNRIKTLREMRRCFGRISSKDNEDGCAFSKSLSSCLRLDVEK